MIPFAQALETVLRHATALPATAMELERSRGLFLASAVTAHHDLPRFDQSAVDGFGVRLADLERADSKHPVCLQVVTAVRAGDRAQPRLAAGQAVKMLTGARVPPSVEAVVMQEFCRPDGLERICFEQPARPGKNIRRKGEEFAKGCVVLQAGVRVTPPVIGLLASLGHARVKVHGRPKVALVVTGNELLRPDEPLRPGKIRDANSYALAAALADLEIENPLRLRASDDARPLRRCLDRALHSADVVIAVGGVSVGDRDLVKEVLADLGVQTVYWQVAIKPGKPNYFGVHLPADRRIRGRSRRPTLVFGLPGNPVAALASFHQLVKPALLRQMGSREVRPLALTATLATNLRKKPGRLEWVRGRLESRAGTLFVHPAAGQDSHMLGGLAQADCLICFPEGESHMAAGQPVAVEMLSWRQ